MTTVVVLGRDPELDAPRLATDPDYFAERLGFYLRDPKWRWYVTEHTHVCPTCQRVIKHTGLEAARDGMMDSHRCCGADVRPRVIV